jgi:integrase
MNYLDSFEYIRDMLGKRQSQKEKEVKRIKKAKTDKYKMETLLNEYMEFLKQKGEDRNKIARIKNYLIPLLGKYDARTITHTDIINNLYKQMDSIELKNATRTKSKTETARKLKYILSQFFKYLFLHHNITNNPIVYLDNQIFKDLFGEHETEKMKAITDLEKLREVYKHIKENKNIQPWTKNLIIFTFLTALRIGTAKELKWNMVDWDKDVIHIPKEITKTRINYTLPLTGKLKNILLEMKEVNGGKGYIFGDRNGFVSSYNAINKNIKKASNGEMTMHGIRTSFETILAERGENILALEVQLMHSLNKTMNSQIFTTYMRSDFLEERRKILEKWEKLLSDKTSEISTN